MNIDRGLLKRNAQVVVRTARPSLFVAAVIFLAVSIVLGYISIRVMGMNISPDDAANYMRYYLDGNYDALAALLGRIQPPPSAYLINIAVSLLMTIVSAGFIIFIFNTLRGAGAVYGNLLDGFGIAGKLIGLYFLEALLIFLWSLLLIVPGLIAAYRYRMAKYIIIDDPSKGVVQSLRESKALMHGHKWECFVLDLSFIGWRLLELLPYLGYAVQVWTTPYIETSYALYYMALSGKPINYTPPQSADGNM